jgi:hypothetical protein
MARGRNNKHSAPSTTLTSAATSVASSAYPSRAPSPTPREPFKFFDLPPELRIRIYEEVLVVSKPLDLGTHTQTH